METLFAHWKRTVKSEVVKDYCIALIWAIFVGLPSFTLHMLVLDYEHYLHGMSLQFSLEVSLKDMIPDHPISVVLWITAVFITVLSVRRAFRQQREIMMMKKILERSQSEAYTDELTGIPNRRAFDRLSKASFEFAKRANQPLTIVMIDMDKLKSFNDQFGHVIGDEALRTIAKHLASFVRAGDAVARYGGDEFAIICPGLSKDDAKGMANRLRDSVLPMEIELSMGVATYPSDGQRIVDIVEFADKLLYLEKEQHHARRKSAKVNNGWNNFRVRM